MCVCVRLCVCACVDVHLLLPLSFLLSHFSKTHPEGGGDKLDGSFIGRTNDNLGGHSRAVGCKRVVVKRRKFAVCDQDPCRLARINLNNTAARDERGARGEGGGGARAFHS